MFAQNKPAFSFGSSAAAPTSAPAPVPAPAAASATPAFSFGNNTANNATATTFGNNTASNPAAGSSLFGANTSNNKPAFGNTAASTNMFGSGAPKPLSLTTPLNNNNTFNSSNNNNNNNTTITTTNNQIATQTAIPSAQPSFAWSNNSTNTAPIASSSSLMFNNQQNSLLQPSNNTINNNNSFNNISNNNSSIPDYTPTISDKLNKLKTKWTTSLTTHVYNKVDNPIPTTRPLDTTPEEWEIAMSKRPSDYHTIAIKCQGFNSLFERNTLQESHVKQTRLLLHETEKKLNSLQDKHSLLSLPQLQKCQNKHKLLQRKLLHIAINLSILKNAGYPLSNDEELMLQQLQTLLQKTQDPLGLARSTELWACLSLIQPPVLNSNSNATANLNTGINGNSVNDEVSVKAKLSNNSSNNSSTNNSSNNENNENSLQEYSETIKNIQNILLQQQVAIETLTSLINNDLNIL